MVKRRKSKSKPKRLVEILYLDNTTELIETEEDYTLKDVLDRACTCKGLPIDAVMLGLSGVGDGDSVAYLDLDSKLLRHAPKQWRLSELGLAPCGKPLLTFNLLVRCYVGRLSSIRDSKLRTYYYYQLKRNFIKFPLLYPDDRCFLMAAYGLLIEDCLHRDEFDPREFFPAWVVDQHGVDYIKQHLPSFIHQFQDIDRKTAEKHAISLMTIHVPIPYNQHLYRLNREVTYTNSSTKPRSHDCVQCRQKYLGIGINGISIFEVGYGGFLEKPVKYAWTKSLSITQNKRKVLLATDNETIILYTESESISSTIVKLCLQTKAQYLCKESFNQSNQVSGIHENTEADYSPQPAIMQTIAESKELEQRLLNLPRTPKVGCLPLQNRFSIVSTASSVTSGIVSDRTCFSYYGSQDEMLNQSKDISSSRDSLLEPSESFKSRPVQRATSEPTKKYDPVRDRAIGQLLTGMQQVLSRTASDETVRAFRKTDDPIYENISAVRSRLITAARAAQDKLSPRVSQDAELLFTPLAALEYSKCKRMLHSQEALCSSTGNLNIYSASELGHKFSSQINIVKPSPSMEQLLKDYSPPPSYREWHEKHTQQLLQRNYQGRTNLHPNDYISENKHNDKKPISFQKCTCQSISTAELNKLRDVKGLPLIEALCKDKLLKPSCTVCNCIKNTAIHSNRPVSWHSETFSAFMSSQAQESCH